MDVIGFYNLSGTGNRHHYVSNYDPDNNYHFHYKKAQPTLFFMTDDIMVLTSFRKNSDLQYSWVVNKAELEGTSYNDEDNSGNSNCYSSGNCYIYEHVDSV